MEKVVHNPSNGHKNIGINASGAIATGMNCMALNVKDMTATGLLVGGTIIIVSKVATSGLEVNVEKDGGAVSGVDLAVLADKDTVGHDLLIKPVLVNILVVRKVMYVVALAGNGSIVIR